MSDSFVEFNSFCRKYNSVQYSFPGMECIVNYNTDNESLNFTDKKTIVFNNNDRETGGFLLINELDSADYFTEFRPLYQTFKFYASQNMLVIKGSSKGNKKFNEYTIEIIIP